MGLENNAKLQKGDHLGAELVQGYDSYKHDAYTRQDSQLLALNQNTFLALRQSFMRGYRDKVAS